MGVTSDSLAAKNGRKRARPSSKSSESSSRPPGSKRGPLKGDADEEIDSDEEEKAYQKGKEFEKTVSKKIDNADDSEEDFFESPEEKRVGLAKKFLDRVGMGSKNDAEIAKKLTLEADVTGKKIRYQIADKVGIIN